MALSGAPLPAADLDGDLAGDPGEGRADRAGPGMGMPAGRRGRRHRGGRPPRAWRRLGHRDAGGPRVRPAARRGSRPARRRGRARGGRERVPAGHRCALHQFVTGVVDLTPGRPARLLDVVPGRSGTVYAAWIADREQAWRDAITFAALDPFRGYATALRTELPAAVRVLDAFHVVRLGFQALDEVRRRVQQETLGHRGYRADPLYGVRRALRRGEEKLTDRAWARIEAALAAGDPDGEVAAAWWCAQRLRGVYLAADPEEGRRRGAEVIELTLSCPVPEVARLGRTLRSWRSEFLAYFATGRASNGPTEAMNLLIEKIRRIGHGFRNLDNYRLRLLLYCGVDWQTAPTPRIRRRRPRMVA